MSDADRKLNPHHGFEEQFLTDWDHSVYTVAARYDMPRAVYDVQQTMLYSTGLDGKGSQTDKPHSISTFIVLSGISAAPSDSDVTDSGLTLTDFADWRVIEDWRYQYDSLNVPRSKHPPLKRIGEDKYTVKDGEYFEIWKLLNSQVNKWAFHVPARPVNDNQNVGTTLIASGDFDENEVLPDTYSFLFTFDPTYAIHFAPNPSQINAVTLGHTPGSGGGIEWGPFSIQFNDDITFNKKAESPANPLLTQEEQAALWEEETKYNYVAFSERYTEKAPEAKELKASEFIRVEISDNQNEYKFIPVLSENQAGLPEGTKNKPHVDAGPGFIIPVVIATAIDIVKTVPCAIRLTCARKEYAIERDEIKDQHGKLLASGAKLKPRTIVEELVVDFKELFRRDGYRLAPEELGELVGKEIHIVSELSVEVFRETLAQYVGVREDASV